MIGEINRSKKGEWQFVKLTDSELAEEVKHVREFNNNLFKNCVLDAKKLLEDNSLGVIADVNEMAVLQLAIALFDKLAMASFTAAKSRLAEEAYKD